MQYSKINYIKKYILIQDIVKEHFDPDTTTYAGVYRKYIYPVYPMTYKRFLEIINMSGLHEQLENEVRLLEEKARQKKESRQGTQIELFGSD